MTVAQDEPAIAVAGLVKRYGSMLAVRDVSFTVARGEVFALLGPNGAGKTTTLEILEGYRDRDGGAVSVLGINPAGMPAQLRERVGVVPQTTTIDQYLTVREILSRHAAYYPNPRGVADVIEMAGLGEKADARAKTLSGGQQRRLDVALSIIGNPELVFLDEPTTGFDPGARRAAWELVRGLTGSGVTVVLTTHYMDEAQALADHVAVIAGGRIVGDGTPDSLAGRDQARSRIRFRLPDGTASSDLPAMIAAAITPVVGADGELELTTLDEVRALHTLTGWALERGVPLVGLRVDRPSLEDVYLELTASARADHAEGVAS